MSRNAIFQSFTFRPDSATTSNSPGVSFLNSSDGPPQPNLSFFGTSDFYSSLSKDFSTTSAKLQQNSSSMLSSAAPSAPRAVGSGISGTAGMAAIATQQLGQGIGQVMTANTENQIQKDFAQNQQSHGVNVGLNSSLIRENAETIKGSMNAGANVGALFGPIGALIGHAIGGISQSNPDLLKTAVTTGGQFNPSDTGIANSASTRGITGNSTLVDNVGNTANI